MIAGHLDALAAELPRRGRWTRTLLAEAAEGLADAAAAYEEAGLSAEDADRRAVEDFGAVGLVAPEFRREIGLRQARRTSRFLCAVLPAALLVWSLVPARLPPGRTVLIAHLGGLALLTVLLAAVALACTGRLAAGSTRLRVLPAVGRLPAAPVLVGDAAIVGGAAVVAASGALLSIPALAAATALSAGGVVWSGALCRRTA